MYKVIMLIVMFGIVVPSQITAKNFYKVKDVSAYLIVFLLKTGKRPH